MWAIWGPEMRVLLIEDDSATAQSIELMLKSENFNVYTTDLGEEGIDLGKLYDYDIILLDLNLPDMSGYEVLRTLRVAKVKTPILILSGLAGIEDKVKGLGFGADDYLTKPFHKDELVARIHAIVRRSKGHAQSVITTGDLIVNLDQKTVEVSGSRVHLTGKEYQMLELLSLRKGTTLTKEMFLNHLYGGMDEPELKIIDVFICKLRKKLANASQGRNYIETVWGRGYVLREPIRGRRPHHRLRRTGARPSRARSAWRIGRKPGALHSEERIARLDGRGTEARSAPAGGLLAFWRCLGPRPKSLCSGARSRRKGAANLQPLPSELARETEHPVEVEERQDDRVEPVNRCDLDPFRAKVGRRGDPGPGIEHDDVADFVDDEREELAAMFHADRELRDFDCRARIEAAAQAHRRDDLAAQVDEAEDLKGRERHGRQRHHFEHGLDGLDRQTEGAAGRYHGEAAPVVRLEGVRRRGSALGGSLAVHAANSRMIRSSNLWVPSTCEPRLARTMSSSAPRSNLPTTPTMPLAAAAAEMIGAV